METLIRMYRSILLVILTITFYSCHRNTVKNNSNPISNEFKYSYEKDGISIDLKPIEGNKMIFNLNMDYPIKKY